MTAATLIALLLAHGPACKPAQAKRIAAAILPAAARRGIDPTLMAAVVITENRGRCNHSIRWERNGSCSHSVFQVNGGCSPEEQMRWRNLHRAARRAARILWLGKRLCLATIGVPHWCRWGWQARYNVGGGRRYVGILLNNYARMKRWTKSKHAKDAVKKNR